MKLYDFVLAESVVPALVSADRDGVITELIDALVTAGVCPKSLRDELIQQIIERENGGSTGFGKGIAVPHVKHEKIKQMHAAIGVSQQGVEFNALDRAPVYCVFLLLSPKDKPDEHLQAMESIFSHLQNDTFRSFLRQAATTEDMIDLIQDADAQHLQG